MDYSEMKIIWDSQNEETIFAIDEKSLYKRIICETRRFGLEIKILEGIGPLTLFGVAGMALRKALLVEDGLVFYATFGIAAAAGIVLIMKLWLRRRSQINYDDSIQGILETSIARIDSLSRLGRNMLLWCFPPMIVIGGLHIYFYPYLKSIVGLLALLAIFSGSLYATAKERHCKHLPRKRGYETLLKNLRGR